MDLSKFKKKLCKLNGLIKISLYECVKFNKHELIEFTME